jgi:hypothetical protein
MTTMKRKVGKLVSLTWILKSCKLNKDIICFRIPGQVMDESCLLAPLGMISFASFHNLCYFRRI